MMKKMYQANLIVHSLETLKRGCKNGGVPVVDVPCRPRKSMPVLNGRVVIRLKWMGTTAGLCLRLGRSSKQAQTTEKILNERAIINWEEEFEHVCVLTMTRKSTFLPWKVCLLVIQIGRQSHVMGTAAMNLGKFVQTTEDYVEHRIKVRTLAANNSQDQELSLMVTLRLRLLEAYGNLSPQRFVAVSLPCLGGQQLENESEAKRCVSSIKTKTSLDHEIVCDSVELSTRSNKGFSHFQDLVKDTESVDDIEHDMRSAEENACVQSYGSLARVNLVVAGALHHSMKSEEPSPPVANDDSKLVDDSSACDSDPNSKGSTRRLLSWRRKKMSFRYSREREEPLLNKECEDGGDDIDCDRRLSCYPIKALNANLDANLGLDNFICMGVSGCIDFGEDNFSIGKWEEKEIVSRDGSMKLKTDVFFASIDQRHERAAGESACTALVAVIADWLHRNLDRMPIQAEFDTLIREGSAEWRKLCGIEGYRDRFPDRHFDLDTVLEANVRPLSVVRDRIFVGFFQPPDGVGSMCDFLKGANTFEDTWDQMEKAAMGDDRDSVGPVVCIVSWNDHFFLLKLDREAYYIIDTLGERLYEGCKQAYILKFGEGTSLCLMPKKEENDKKAACKSSRKINKEKAACVSLDGMAATPGSHACSGGQSISKEGYNTFVSKTVSSLSSVFTSSAAAPLLTSAITPLRLSASSSPSCPPQLPSSSSVVSSSPPQLSSPSSPSALLSSILPCDTSSLTSLTSTSTFSPLASPPSPSEPTSESSADSCDCQANDTGKEGIIDIRLQNFKDFTVYTAKDACKEFVKGFFASLPLQELKTDIQKGLLKGIPPHTRLQIEFTFTSIGDGERSELS